MSPFPRTDDCCSLSTRKRGEISHIWPPSSLRYIKDIPSLRRLKVWWRLPITERGIAHLAKCHQLEELELAKLPVTDRNLSQLKVLPRLRSLDVSGGESKVTDAGMVHVGQIKQLESLSLPSTITDTGAAQLAGNERVQKENATPGTVPQFGTVPQAPHVERSRCQSRYKSHNAEKETLRRFCFGPAFNFCGEMCFFLNNSRSRNGLYMSIRICYNIC